MNLPEPFLGRLLVEVVRDTSEDFYKTQAKAQHGDSVSSEFLNKFQLATEVKGKVPISKGKIVKKAPDCFGQAFTDRYGDIGYKPKEGDIVLFIPNGSYRIDPADTYHLIADCDICGYEKAESKVVPITIVEEVKV